MQPQHFGNEAKQSLLLHRFVSQALIRTFVSSQSGCYNPLYAGHTVTALQPQAFGRGFFFGQEVFPLPLSQELR